MRVPARLADRNLRVPEKPPRIAAIIGAARPCPAIGFTTTMAEGDGERTRARCRRARAWRREPCDAPAGRRRGPHADAGDRNRRDTASAAVDRVRPLRCWHVVGEPAGSNDVTGDGDQWQQARDQHGLEATMMPWTRRAEETEPEARTPYNRGHRPAGLVPASRSPERVRQAFRPSCVRRWGLWGWG
jgi:hypothetical protein